MKVERANTDDVIEYRQMDLGLEHDYVAHIFSEVAAGGCLYKATMDGRMVGVARLNRIDDDHAYLGQARVDRRYRNQGIITSLSNELIQVASERGYSWVGLCTNLENSPARRVAEKVGMKQIGLHLSCNCHRSEGEGTLPAGVLLELGVEQKIRTITAAYEKTDILPRRPYGMIPWPTDGVSQQFTDALTPVQFCTSKDGWVEGFSNSLAEPQLQILLLEPARKMTQDSLNYISEEFIDQFPAVHLEFPVCQEEDWHDIPRLADHWHVNRYVVYGFCL